MTLVSLTRVRLRSVRFLPLFLLHTTRSIRQARRAAGFQSGMLLADRRWTFWTMTAWDTQESMLAFMSSGSHKRAMPYLLNWAAEASVAHWKQPEAALPSWPEADHRMRTEGRASKVHHPSPQHASLAYQPPRITRSRPIQRS